MKKILRKCIKLNLARKTLVVLLVFAMTFGTFAAVVSDNDSSAFVTKAELEALKTSYEKQVKNYYDKINEKVDNTIVAYLNNWKNIGPGGDTDPFPVGSIYVSVDNVDPGTIFGGTWRKFGEGKTLIGQDEADSDFNTLGKTGGEKTITLELANVPRHEHEFVGTRKKTASDGAHDNHKFKFSQDIYAGSLTATTGNWGDAEYGDASHSTQTGGKHTHYLTGPTTGVTIGKTGASSPSPFDKIQPSIIVSLWERIA